MGEESQHQDTRPRVEKVFEDGQICAENRRHLVRFINMSLQEQGIKMQDREVTPGYAKKAAAADDDVPF